jgi:DNA-binding transcriptional MerR regulator
MRRPLAIHGPATLIRTVFLMRLESSRAILGPSAKANPEASFVAVKSKPAKLEQPLVPEKLYFRIGEVAELCRLPAYVLRFWESEFPQLKPIKSSTGQRMYRQRDVEYVLRIKQLLYDEGFTIPGARERLKSEIKQKRAQNVLPFPAGIPATELKRIRQGLQDILSLLSPQR